MASSWSGSWGTSWGSSWGATDQSGPSVFTGGAWGDSWGDAWGDSWGARVHTASTTSSGGQGVYRYLPPATETECKQEIQELEDEKEKVQTQIETLEERVEDDNDALRYEDDMNKVKGLVVDLTETQQKLNKLRLKIIQIEEEEMMLTACLEDVM